MPASDALYSILNAQAGLDHTRAVTQDTQALAQQRIQNLILSQQASQREQAMRERLQSSAFANPTGGAAPPVNGNPPPLTTSIYGIDFDANDPLVLSAKSAQEGVDLSRQRLALTQEAGDVQGYFKAQQDHDNQQKENRLAMKDLAVDALRRTKEAAQAFGSVETPDDLKAALLYVNDNISKTQARAIAAQLQKSLPDPSNATPEQIAAAVAPITNRYASMGDQLRFRGSQQAAQDRAAALEERQRHNLKAEANAAQKQAAVGGGATPFEQLTPDRQEAVKTYADMTIGGDQSWRVGLGRTKSGSELILQVDENVPKRMAELGLTAADVGTNKAKRIAAQASLNQIGKDLNNIEPFAKMLDQNADILKDLSSKVIKTDSALANKPINWLQRNVGDNPDFADYMAQMRLLQTEASRVITTPRLVGQLTDSARKEIEDIINGDMTLGSTARVIDRIKNDSQRRVGLMKDQQKSNEETIRAMTPGGSRAPAGAPRAGAEMTDAQGQMQVAPLTATQIQIAARSAGVAPAMTKADRDALAPGARYVGPDGQVRVR